jgi:hypothetical protein
VRGVCEGGIGGYRVVDWPWCEWVNRGEMEGGKGGKRGVFDPRQLVSERDCSEVVRFFCPPLCASWMIQPDVGNAGRIMQVMLRYLTYTTGSGSNARRDEARRDKVT